MPKNHGKFSLQIPTANSRGKQPWQIPAAKSPGQCSRKIFKYVMLKMMWSNPMYGRASHVKIKRKQETKQKFIEA